MKLEPPAPTSAGKNAYKISLLVTYVLMSILFGGMWVISATYIESFLAVWSVPKAGPYMILNSLVSIFGGLLVGFNLRGYKVSGVLLLTVPILFVFLDMLDIFFRIQENQNEVLSQVLTQLLFPPLFIHVYMLYLSAKIALEE